MTMKTSAENRYNNACIVKIGSNRDALVFVTILFVRISTLLYLFKFLKNM